MSEQPVTPSPVTSTAPADASEVSWRQHFRRAPRPVRWAVWVALGLVLLLVVLAAVATWTVRRPLPQTGGEIEVPGLAADVEVKAQLARASVAALEAHAKALTSGDAKAARHVFKAAQTLIDVAEQIGDATLAFGTREMARYLQAQGATDRLDPEVVRTHVSALHQLAHLPHALGGEREAVAQSLKRMVDKKLRQIASNAA